MSNVCRNVNLYHESFIIESENNKFGKELQTKMSSCFHNLTPDISLSVKLKDSIVGANININSVLKIK